EQEVAVGKGLVPLQVKITAIDGARELQADALAAPRVFAVLGDLAGELDRLGDALDGDLTLQRDLTVAAHLGGGGTEADLRVLLGVEELRALQVAVAVGVARVDRGDLDASLQDRRIARGVDRAVERAEAATD